MKKTKALKKAAKLIESGITEKDVLGQALLEEGVTLSAVNGITVKAMKEAGLVTVTSGSAVKECKAYLADSMPEMLTYDAMTTHADDMATKFEIAETTALNAIKAQLKESALVVPTKDRTSDEHKHLCNWFANEYDATKSTSADCVAYINKQMGTDMDNEVEVKRILNIVGTKFGVIKLVKDEAEFDV